MNDTQQLLKAIQDIEKRLTARLDSMQADISGLKGGQKSMQEDISGLKEGQKTMQADISGLKTGQKTLEKGQEQTNKRLNTMQDDITGIKKIVARIDDKLETGTGSSLDEESAMKAEIEKLKKRLDEHIRLSQHH